MFSEENGIFIENSIHKIYISKTKWIDYDKIWIITCIMRSQDCWEKYQ